jgi:hypothetical protein
VCRHTERKYTRDFKVTFIRMCRVT